MLRARIVALRAGLKFFMSELYKMFTSFTALGLLFATLVIPLCLAIAYSGLMVASGSTLNRKSFFESLAISYIPLVVILCLLSLTTFSQDYLSPGRDRLRMQANQFGQIFTVKSLVNILVVFVFSAIGFLAAFLCLDLRFNHSALGVLVSQDISFAYLAANELPLVAIAFLATLISLSSSTYLQGLLHFFLVLLVLPSALGTLSVDGINLAWFTPLSALQAISTFPGATPFTLQGLSPSTLPTLGSLAVLLGWLISYCAIFCLVEYGRNKRNKSPQKSNGSSAVNVPRLIVADSSRQLRRGKFIQAFMSSVYSLASDSTTNRILVTWLIAAYGLTVLAYQRLAGQDFGMPARAAALFFQSSVLGSTVQMESLFLAFLGVSLISRESFTHTLQRQLMSIPNRKVWLWSKVAAYCSYFFVISLVTFLVQLLATTNWFSSSPSVGYQGLAMYLWFASHSLFFGTCAGLLGLLFGLVIRSSLWNFLAVGLVFVIIPSLLSGFSQALVDIGLPFVANSVCFFPFAGLGVHWLGPNAWMPQFLADGRLNVNSDQEVLVYLGWLTLLLLLSHLRNRRLSELA
jgi:ABC-type transport system involved in multi-copper enzyme maturation permease subunit